MGFDFKAFFKNKDLWLGIASAVVPGVGIVESAVQVLKSGQKGAEKQQAVIDLIKGGLMAAEDVTDKDLLDDVEVEAATRAVIDSVVHLQNVIRAAKAARTPAGV